MNGAWVGEGGQGVTSYNDYNWPLQGPYRGFWCNQGRDFTSWGKLKGREFCYVARYFDLIIASGI